MRKLSKYEKETIINWNEAENLASIYTFNASLKRRLADFSRKYPLLCRLERSTPEGSVTYESPSLYMGHVVERCADRSTGRLLQITLWHTTSCSPLPSLRPMWQAKRKFRQRPCRK